MKGNTLDFSFSGLKTAVLRWIEARDMAGEIAARRALRREPATQRRRSGCAVTPQATLDLLASFQYTVIEELLRRAARAAEEIGARASIDLRRRRLQRRPAPRRRAPRVLAYPVFFPTPGLSTDNAAMIAAAAFPKLVRGEFSDLSLQAEANLSIA